MTETSIASESEIEEPLTEGGGDTTPVFGKVNTRAVNGQRF